MSEYLWRGVVLQVASLALLAGVTIETEEALLQGHLQLLFVGMGVVLRRGHKLLLQNADLDKNTHKKKRSVNVSPVILTAHFINRGKMLFHPN